MSASSPYGAVVQLGFVVPDLDRAVEAWLARGVGPFFEMRHVPLAKQVYRGAPTSIDMSVAIAYSGPLQLELIQQHDEGASLYRDFLAEQPRGGLHHLAFLCEDYEGALAKAAESGRAVAQEWTNALGGRFAYLERDEVEGTYVELLEAEPRLLQFFGFMRKAAEGWKGEAPRRSFGG